VGLIARIVEAHGIPTLVYCTVRDITAKVNPPRAAFLDYPVGNAAGRPNDAADQRAVIEAGLRSMKQSTGPGSILDLPFTWNGEDRSWEEDIRSIYLSQRGGAVLRRQRILMEGLQEEFADELRRCEDTLCGLQ